MTKISGSGSGSISQRHGSADPDPHQNAMDPQHWIDGKYEIRSKFFKNVIFAVLSVAICVPALCNKRKKSFLGHLEPIEKGDPAPTFRMPI
jgi:hypothetical protein